MSYISRNYGNNGGNLIKLKGGAKVKKYLKSADMYIMGGNCGCSSCLTGAGFDVNFLRGAGWLEDRIENIRDIGDFLGYIPNPYAQAVAGVIKQASPILRWTKQAYNKFNEEKIPRKIIKKNKNY